MKVFILLFSLMQLFTLQYAYAGFFDQKSRGWHWYEQEKQNKEKQGKAAGVTLTPTEQVEAIRKDVEAKLHKGSYYSNREERHSLY
ncbi:exported hypothetical protein [Alphaproteobacteria bacterium]